MAAVNHYTRPGASGPHNQRRRVARCKLQGFSQDPSQEWPTARITSAASRNASCTDYRSNRSQAWQTAGGLPYLASVRTMIMALVLVRISAMHLRRLALCMWQCLSSESKPRVADRQNHLHRVALCKLHGFSSESKPELPCAAKGPYLARVLTRIRATCKGDAAELIPGAPSCPGS